MDFLPTERRTAAPLQPPMVGAGDRFRERDEVGAWVSRPLALRFRERPTLVPLDQSPRLFLAPHIGDGELVRRERA